MHPSIASVSSSTVNQDHLDKTPTTVLSALTQETQPLPAAASSKDMRETVNTSELKPTPLNLPPEMRELIFKKIIDPSRTGEAIRSDLAAMHVNKELRSWMANNLSRLYPRYALGMGLSALVSYVTKSPNLLIEGALTPLYANTSQTSLLRHIKYELLHQVVTKDQQLEQMVCKILQAEHTLYGFVSIELGQLRANLLPANLFDCLNKANIHDIRIVYSEQYAQITQMAITELQACTQTRKLSLKGVQELTDADLTCLASLVNLTELDLSYCKKITAHGLAHLAGLTQLENLNLSHCINALNISSLAQLPALKTLNLSGIQGLSNHQLQHLTGLTALEELNLSGCQGLTDLSPLAELVALKTLNLSECTQLSNLLPLAALTALENLYLKGLKRLTDLSSLRNLAALRVLFLSQCTALPNQSLQSLTGLTKLEKLSLIQCNNVTNLQPLAGLVAMKWLCLSGLNQLNNQSLLPLAGMTQLETLSLQRCIHLSDLAPLENLTRLKVLDLDNIQNLNNERLTPLAKLTALEDLDLANCIHISRLNELGSKPQLQRLILNNCTGLTDEGLADLAVFTRLKNIGLQRCLKISYKGLTPLIDLKQLQTIDCCENIMLNFDFFFDQRNITPINRWEINDFFKQIHGQNRSFIERYNRALQSIGIGLSLSPHLGMLTISAFLLIMLAREEGVFVWDNRLTIAERLGINLINIPLWGVAITFTTLMSQAVAFMPSFLLCRFLHLIADAAYRPYKFNPPTA